jgi:hypothetical protein
MTVIDKLKQLRACDSNGHAVQIKTGLRLVAALPELAINTILNTGTLKLQYVPGLKGFYAIFS